MAGWNNECIRESLDKCYRGFPGCFINMRNELILHRKHNIYMRLEDLENDFDFKVKVIQALSRDCCKGGLSEKARKEFRNKVNEFLDVDFSQNDWANIYAYSNRTELIIIFVLNNFDLEIIKSVGWYE